MIAARNAKVAKADWKTVKLGDISVDGGHYGIGAPAVEYDECLPTYLRITDIRDDGSICKEGLKSVDSEDAEEYYLKPNDLVIARTGASTGRNYFYDGRDGDFVYAGFLIKFSIDENKIWPPYVKYWFKGDEYRSWLNNHTDGSTRANINAVTLAECPIRVPKSLPTQRKIAAVLGALDDKIENNRKICANLEAQAQALFKSWFVDFEPFGGKMPKDWKMGKLGDVAEITMGQSPDGKSLNENNEGVTFFQGRAEFGNRFPTKRLSTTEPKRMARKGDILLSVRAPVGDLNVALEDCCIGRGLAAIRSKGGVSSFLLSLLKSKKADFDLYEGAGTIFGSINKDSLHDLQVIIPSDDTMKDYERVISSADAVYHEKELESRALAELRDALLPKLMSGELDVDDVEV